MILNLTTRTILFLKYFFTLKSINKCPKMSAEGLTDHMNVCGRIRQAQSVSPFLFHLILNRIIKVVKENYKYFMLC